MIIVIHDAWMPRIGIAAKILIYFVNPKLEWLLLVLHIGLPNVSLNLMSEF